MAGAPVEDSIGRILLVPKGSMFLQEKKLDFDQTAWTSRLI